MTARPSILLIGAGNMGRAMLVGWKKNSVADAITIIDPSPDAELQRNHIVLRSIEALDDNAFFDIVVLAVKPQNFPAILPELVKRLSPKTLVLSIAAGKTIAGINEVLGETMRVIRAMPNTPAMIGEGIAVCVANAHVTSEEKIMAESLLKAIGDVAWIDDEDMMHAVTALSGSGPAYLFALIEAMEKAGRILGLPDTLASVLARKTVEGASLLSRHNPGKTPLQLREQVTSRGGTTEAALEILLGPNGLNELMTYALKAAAQRSEELST